MRLPFGYADTETLNTAIESGNGGTYPFTMGNFWHSGVHISPPDGVQREFDAIVPSGKVILYRISPKYQEINLPKTLSKNDYVHYPYCESYLPANDGRYYVLNEHAQIQTYGISNTFMLFKYELPLITGPLRMVFYVLYMNLAPLSDYKGSCCYTKNGFICDGNIHYPDNPFEVKTIGMPGYFKGKCYFDLVVFTDVHLFEYQKVIKDELLGVQKQFIGLKRNCPMFMREECAAAQKIFFPNWSKCCVLEEVSVGTRNAKKIQLRSIRACLYSGGRGVVLEMGEQNVTEGSEYHVTVRDGFVFSDGKTFTFNTTEDTDGLEYLRTIIGDSVEKIESDKHIIVTKYNKNYAIDIDLYRYGTGYYEFWVDDEYITMFDEKGQSEFLCDTGNREITIYTTNPLVSKFTKTGTAECTEQVQLEDDKTGRDANGRTYQQCANGMYIRQDDMIYADLFAFDQWFTDAYKEPVSRQYDLICDKTTVVKELITRQHRLIQQDLLREPMLEQFWTGPYISNTLLRYVFGLNEGAWYQKLLRKHLRRCLCVHPIEWDKSKFKHLERIKADYVFARTYSVDQRQTLVEQAEKTDLWEGGLSELFKENKFYFAHPLYFLEHLEKARVFEFNPYEGKTYEEVFCNKDNFPEIIKNNFTETKDSKIVDNPGFAPVFDEANPNRPNPNINGYACVTGFFNENYLKVRRGNNKTYEDEGYTVFTHEGIDFRGTEGTEIKSLIYGTVLGYGKDGSYGRTIYICNKEKTGVYLLAHLQSFRTELLDAKEIVPGDIVGTVGSSGQADSNGNIDGRYDSHLHVSYFVIDSNEGITNMVKNDPDNGTVTRTGLSSKGVIRNPFNHESLKLPNKSREEE